MDSEVPAIRVRAVNGHKINQEGKWVLYWMTAFRRVRSNFALQYARDFAAGLDRPLLILEALRLRYRWASDRLHRFIVEGMRDNAADCQDANVTYFPYVEPEHGAGSGLLEQLAQPACLVITDDYPCFFHPRMLRVAAKVVPVSLRAVDANCLMPLAHADRTFTVAHSYRRWMQKELPHQLEALPQSNPLDGRRTRFPGIDSGSLREIHQRWPAADIHGLLEGGISQLPIDHAVAPGAVTGGSHEAQRLLTRFVEQRLTNYDEERNEPDEYGSSELSPHLHFGHISPHQVFAEVMESQQWNPGQLRKPNGKVNGFWGVSGDAEAFLDQLCTWREIGFNMTWREDDFDQLDSLPSWTQETIREHADDPREHVYTLEQFEGAETHDEIWNAAQRQLVREGRIHNYMRMLWGKKILHWTASVADALAIMLELNNKYGLDGRDPNSYSGIFWVLGRYDRAWGPERPIFGKIRYMTSENTAKKHRLKEYLERYAE